MEGIGALAFWGLSPMLDLASLVVPRVSDDSAGVTNVLIVGSGDPRHILRTFVGAHRRPGSRVNFHIVESAMELHARSVALMALTMEPRHELGLQEKAEFFAEIFGNTLIRAKTSEYLAAKVSLLIKAVTNPVFAKSALPYLDLSALKFRDRDDLEAIFKSWRQSDEASFDVRRLWDERVRTYLRARYDSRANIADWDYNMRLRDVAPTIHAKQYEAWRDRGVAFEPRDADYNCVNRTLAGDIVSRDASGTKVLKRGYWGDISTGPFVAFGTQCEDAAMLEKVNSQHAKTAVEITVKNLVMLLHELQTGRRWSADEQFVTAAQSSDPAQQVAAVSVGVQAIGGSPGAPLEDDVCAGASAPLPGVIELLPPNSTEALASKPKYHALFHVMYFDCHMAHQLTPSVRGLLAPGGKLVLETAKYTVDLSPDQKAAFLAKLNERATAAGFSPAQHDVRVIGALSMPENPDFAVFVENIV